MAARLLQSQTASLCSVHLAALHPSSCRAHSALRLHPVYNCATPLIWRLRTFRGESSARPCSLARQWQARQEKMNVPLPSEGRGWRRPGLVGQRRSVRRCPSAATGHVSHPDGISGADRQPATQVKRHLPRSGRLRLEDAHSGLRTLADTSKCLRNYNTISIVQCRWSPLHQLK